MPLNRRGIAPPPWFVLVLSAAAGCSGGGGANGPAPPAAPESLTYSAPSPTYIVGIAIAPNIPSHAGGSIESYSVLPALPPGLDLAPTTGVVSGTPAVAMTATTYAVTGMNVSGSTTAYITITVVPPPPPPLQPPSNLVYSSPVSAYPFQVPITPNVPSSSGGPVEAYSIAPALPAGLGLDPLSGVISGTPSMTSAAASYIVTAANAAGTATAGIILGVVGHVPWQTTAGGTETDLVGAAAAGPNGVLYLSGTYQAPLTLGAGAGQVTLPNTNFYSNLFVARFAVD